MRCDAAFITGSMQGNMLPNVLIKLMSKSIQEIPGSMANHVLIVDTKIPRTTLSYGQLNKLA